MSQHRKYEDEIAGLRAEYAVGGLSEIDLAADPIAMFERWFTQILEHGLPEPNAMVLATTSASGAPSARTVLLKSFDVEGFSFYTNLASRKGQELAHNQSCCLLFPWHPVERQVRVEGRAELLSREEVAAYFASRPRGAQLGAWASSQSRPVAGREALTAAYDEVERRYADAPVPVPDHWGGYLVRPEVVEFWQGRPSRMHDRLVYRRDGEGWAVERLAP